MSIHIYSYRTAVIYGDVTVYHNIVTSSRENFIENVEAGGDVTADLGEVRFVNQSGVKINGTTIRDCSFSSRDSADFAKEGERFVSLRSVRVEEKFIKNY